MTCSKSGTGKKRMKGTGRKKIEMKKIANIKNRRVCFSKRREGMFKKAQELARMTGCSVAALIFSPESMKPRILGNIELIEQAAAAAAGGRRNMPSSSSSSMLKLTSGFIKMELSFGDISVEPLQTSLSSTHDEHCNSFGSIGSIYDVYRNQMMRVGGSSSSSSIATTYENNNGIFTTEQLLAPESSAFCDQFLIDNEDEKAEEELKRLMDEKQKLASSRESLGQNNDTQASHPLKIHDDHPMLRPSAGFRHCR